MAPYTSAPQAPDPFTATRTRMTELDYPHTHAVRYQGQLALAA